VCIVKDNKNHYRSLVNLWYQLPGVLSVSSIIERGPCLNSPLG
jgi:hypothetical protein